MPDCWSKAHDHASQNQRMGYRLMESNPPPPIDNRISIKEIAERCGLEVRKMSKIVIRVRGKELRATPYRFTSVRSLKQIFRSIKSAGVGRVYLYSVVEQTYKNTDGSSGCGYVMRIAWHKDVGAISALDADIAAGYLSHHARPTTSGKVKLDRIEMSTERRMREFKFGTAFTKIKGEGINGGNLYLSDKVRQLIRDQA